MKQRIFLRVIVVLFTVACNACVEMASPSSPHPLPPPPLQSHVKAESVTSQRISKTEEESPIPPRMLPRAMKQLDINDRIDHRQIGVQFVSKEEKRISHQASVEDTENSWKERHKSSSRSSRPRVQLSQESPSPFETETGTLAKNIQATDSLEIKLASFLQKIPSRSDLGAQNGGNVLWNNILSRLGVYYLPSTKESIVNNTQCREDVGRIYNPQTKGQKSNATILVDSWGKIPDGFLVGNFMSMGSFEECLKVKMPRDEPGDEELLQGSFKGKYCNVYYVPYYNPNETDAKPGDPMEVKMAPMSMVLFDGYAYLEYGTCMPSSCNEEDLMNSLNHFLVKANKTVPAVYCQTEDDPVIEYTAGLISMIVLLSLFAVLLLGGTAVDIWIQYTTREELRKGPLKYLLVFAFYTNLEKMFKINTAENKEAITSFYGMRVLSMTWVVWGHQYFVNNYYVANSSLESQLFNGHWMSQIILNAYPSVDSFFFMSGLLVAYGILKEKERSGGFNIFVFYVHRYLRLCVPILLIAGFCATMSRYLAHGPYAATTSTTLSLEKVCQNYWWRDALFISNFYDLTCLGVCWYTAVDFQLFLVTPIILFPIIWGDKFKLNIRPNINIGYIWLGFVTLLSVIIPGVLTAVYKLPPTSIMGESDRNRMLEMNEVIYMKPWCRAQPYLVGMWLGIFLRRDTKRELIKLQMWQVIAGWLVAIATGLAIVFGMYNYNQFFDYQDYYWPDSVFYAALHRLAWGLCLAWIVFACHYGYGGPVNSFLSHPSWQPVSRLTYCIFLVAFPVQVILYDYHNVYPVYMSHLNKILETVGALFFAGIASVLLSLCAEAPVLGLEKLLLRKGNQKQT